MMDLNCFYNKIMKLERVDVIDVRDSIQENIVIDHERHHPYLYSFLFAFLPNNCRDDDELCPDFFPLTSAETDVD